MRTAAPIRFRLLEMCRQPHSLLVLSRSLSRTRLRRCAQRRGAASWRPADYAANLIGADNQPSRPRLVIRAKRAVPRQRRHQHDGGRIEEPQERQPGLLARQCRRQRQHHGNHVGSRSPGTMVKWPPYTTGICATSSLRRQARKASSRNCPADHQNDGMAHSRQGVTGTVVDTMRMRLSRALLTCRMASVLADLRAALRPMPTVIGGPMDCLGFIHSPPSAARRTSTGNIKATVILTSKVSSPVAIDPFASYAALPGTSTIENFFLPDSCRSSIQRACRNRRHGSLTTCGDKAEDRRIRTTFRFPWGKDRASPCQFWQLARMGSGL